MRSGVKRSKGQASAQEPASAAVDRPAVLARGEGPDPDKSEDEGEVEVFWPEGQGGPGGSDAATDEDEAWVPAWRTRPSKSRRKAQMHELQSLGDTLVGLTDNQFASVPLPEDLRDAVKAARGMTRLDEARRRQLQYIGKLMRGVDPEPIRAHIAAWHSQSVEQARLLHEIERWRERLLAEPAALTAFADQYRPQDMQGLRTTLREASRERAAVARGEARSPRHYRELFRRVRETILASRGQAEAAQTDAAQTDQGGPDDQGEDNE
jgi:ribosome-associated protein